MTVFLLNWLLFPLFSKSNSLKWFIALKSPNSFIIKFTGLSVRPVLAKVQLRFHYEPRTQLFDSLRSDEDDYNRRSSIGKDL